MGVPKDPIKRAEWIAKQRESHKGKCATDETKQKISESHKGEKHHFYGKKFSEEYRKKLSKAHKGIRQSEETKQKISMNAKINPNYGMKGKKQSIESKMKISRNKKGKKLPPFSKEHRMKISKGLMGIKRSEESKRKISESHQGKNLSEKHKNRIGISNKKFNKGQFKKGQFALEKHPNWNNGSSFEPYGLSFNEQFREKIRKRDNRCCIICNVPEEELKYKLHIHHIDYDKKNNFPQNCISLCRYDHIRTNFNREHWKVFFQSLMKEKYNYEYTEDQKIILDFMGDKNCHY